MFSTQVNLFLKKCTQVNKILKKRGKGSKRSKIEKETKVETEAERLKAFILEEKSFKFCPKSTLTDPALKTLMGDSRSKWVLQTESKILPPKPKTASKAPPAPLPTLLGPPVKRKGPGQ